MGSKTPPTTTQTTKTEMSPEQKEIFKLGFPYAQQYAQTPIQQYQGTGIAPLTPLEQQASTAALGGGQAGGDLAAKSKDAQSLMLDPSFMLDPSSNPWLMGSAQAMAGQINQNLMENQLPAIAHGATMAGGAYSGGSSREGIAQGKAIAGTNVGISDAVTKMMFDAYNRGLTGMQGAIQANPGVQSQQLFQPGVMSVVGAQERDINQAQLNEQIQKFYTGQALPFLQAQELMSLIQGMPGGATTSTATGSVPGVNPVMSGLGGAAAGASVGSMFGPIGTGVGAAGGGLLSYLMNR